MSIKGVAKRRGWGGLPVVFPPPLSAEVILEPESLGGSATPHHGDPFGPQGLPHMNAHEGRNPQTLCWPKGSLQSPWALAGGRIAQWQWEPRVSSSSTLDNASDRSRGLALGWSQNQRIPEVWRWQGPRRSSSPPSFSRQEFPSKQI